MSLYDSHNGHRRSFSSRLHGRRHHAAAASSTGVKPPYGRVLQFITLSQLASKESGASGHNVQIKDCRQVASYTWTSAANPSVLVPGIPARWTPLPMPITLQQDSSIYFRDKNACRTPDHPMEAAILSVLEADASPNGTSSDLEDVDLVACSSTLGNLLRFCSKDAKPFRMIVHTVGKTVHFVRRENNPRETIPDVFGYGHTFPEAFTSWDACVPGSESHQRIVSYRLGGLNCLVRFEADGYLPAKNRVAIPRNSTTYHAESTSVDEITSILTHGATFINNKSHTAAPITASAAGVQVDPESLFDLKTRSVKRRHEEAEILASEIPRLWIRQMSNFILAFHNRGTFEDVQVKDVGHEVDR